LDRVGIQLYSVREDMRRDMPGTLARLAEIGYREVEFAGYFGRSPEETRRLLAQNGLTAPSAHIGLDQLANWDRALDDAVARGHQYVTIPWVPENMRGSAEGWRRMAADFNRAAERAKTKGLQFAYHNHDFELQRVDGVVPLDLLLAETDPALVQFEMDIYWVTRAGGDPIEYIRRHPTRFSMLHAKDSAGAPEHRMVDVGAGAIDFAAILRLDASQRGAVRHVFVEHDNPADAMAFARRSFDHLSRLEY
jgi:sugar phosphate isomerase/epimerase